MSIITLPRRPETPTHRPSTSTRRPEAPRRRPVDAPAPSGAHHRVARRGLLQRWTTRTTTTKVATIAVTTLVILLAGNSYVAQRQVQLHQLQTEDLSLQAHYAQQIAALTNVAAPARVASQAGHLHLVVPSTVTQIATVPLSVVLPTAKLQGAYSLELRTYR